MPGFNKSGGGGGASWGSVTGTLANQTDLQTVLDAKSSTGHNHDANYSAAGHNHDADYSTVGHNHDVSYSALGHSHSGLTPAGGTTGQILKKNTNTDYDYGWAADSTGSGGGAAWGSITGTLSAQTDLQSELNGKSGTGHNHDATYQALSSKNAASGYPGLDASSKLTGSQQVYGTGADTACPGNDSRLSDARTPTTHATSHKSGGGDAVKLDELAAPTDVTTLNASITAHGLLPKLPNNAAQYLNGVGGWAAPGGGSDPWIYAVLASDFTTTSGTAVDVTGLAFTPSANTKYEFEAMLMTRTATATVGPRPGLAWPTGMTDGVARIKQTSSATAELTTNGNISAALLCAVGGLPNTTQSHPANIKGIVVAGATPSGTVKVQLASETAGTTVTIKAGSFIKYRTYS